MHKSNLTCTWFHFAAGLCLASACNRHPSARLEPVSTAALPTVTPLSSAVASTHAAPALDSSTQPPGAATSNVPTPPTCRQFEAEQGSLATRWPDPTYLPKVLGKCYPTKSGAWAIRFERIKASEGVAVSARFVVVHLGNDGKVVPAPFQSSPFAGRPDAPRIPAGSNYVLSPGEHYTDVFVPDVFDFDGDGDGELLFMAQAYVSEGGKVPFSGSQVFTWRSGAVTSYEPAARLAWVGTRDIDGDHRPDLIGSYLGISVAAHSLTDGTFSQTDAAAQAFAQRTCPPGKTSAFLSVDEDDAGFPELQPSGWNGACALLWGATPEVVIREIDKHCAAVDCTRKSALTDEVVDSADIYRSLVRTKPPLRFDRH